MRIAISASYSPWDSQNLDKFRMMHIAKNWWTAENRNCPLSSARWEAAYLFHEKCYKRCSGF